MGEAETLWGIGVVMKKILFVVVFLCVIIFMLSRMLVIRNPDVAGNKMVSLFNGQDFDQLVVSLVGQNEILLSVQEKEVVRQFWNLIEIEKNIGAVMSAGTYRLVFSRVDQSTVSFQLVLGEFLRHEGGSDFKLTDQSSQAIKQWLATYEIIERVRPPNSSLSE